MSQSAELNWWNAQPSLHIGTVAVLTIKAEQPVLPVTRLDNTQLSVWGLRLFELYRKIAIKIERAFSVILRTSPATHLSFQQSPQLPNVAVTSSSCGNLWQLSSICFPEIVSKCQTGKSFPSNWRSSPVTAWYNYIIIATFEGWKL